MISHQCSKQHFLADGSKALTLALTLRDDVVDDEGISVNNTYNF